MCAMRRCCLLQVTACCFDRNSPSRILKLAHYSCSCCSNILYLLYTQLNSKKRIILRVATTLAQPSATQPPPPSHYGLALLSHAWLFIFPNVFGTRENSSISDFPNLKQTFWNLYYFLMGILYSVNIFLVTIKNFPQTFTTKTDLGY